MKACIVTFHSAYNYGAVLQAYALWKYLNDNYAETKILDYHNKKIDDSYRIPKFSSFVSNPVNAIFKFVQYILYIGKRKKINKFVKLFSTTQKYDARNIHLASTEADVFIAGSDQIWNYELVGNDLTYFLDFAQKSVKCSYAASFGISEVPEKYRDFYYNGLENLDYISVREENAVHMVKSLCDKRCQVMPDPTLLIDVQKWDEVIKENGTKRSYILLYKITKAEKLISFAKMLSKETGLPIVYIPNDIKSGFVGTTKFNIGPDEWLGYIKNSEYVVTNSFHGTVFSILFGKKFFAEVSTKANMATGRLSSLLKLFNLEDRIISNYKPEMIEKELSQNDISAVIDEQRIKVKNYFDTIFGGKV